MNDLNARITNFVAASGTLGKRAMDALSEKQAAEKTAQALIPGLVDLLVDANLTTVDKKAEHAEALTDHATTLQVMANLVGRFKTASASSKTASTIGSSVEDNGEAAQSTPSPYVGVPTGNIRKTASAQLFADLGLGYGY